MSVQLSVALPVPGGGGGVGGSGEGGGDDDGGAETDNVGMSNCERPDICSARRCIPRPPVALLADDTEAPVPAPANAFAAAAFDVDSVALANGRDAPVEVLEAGAVVRGNDACPANTVPAIGRRLSLRVGIVDAAGERGAGLPAESDDAVIAPCPGRLVNFRWNVRAAVGAGTEDDGVVLAS